MADIFVSKGQKTTKILLKQQNYKKIHFLYLVKNSIIKVS